MVRNYEKGTKLLKRYERGMKRLRNKLPRYQKGTKLKRYGVTKRYDVTKRVGRGYEISYEIVTPPIGLICYDV